MSATRRNANSQAGWALVTEGVTNARVHVHRLRHLLTRLVDVCEDPRYGELMNRLLGDIAKAGPNRLDQIEVILDRTSYALAKMGEEHLKGRLPLEDLTMVDEAIEGSKPFGSPRERAGLDPDKLARWFHRRAHVRQARRER